jgi:hypothetical protein
LKLIKSSDSQRKNMIDPSYHLIIKKMFFEEGLECYEIANKLGTTTREVWELINVIMKFESESE